MKANKCGIPADEKSFRRLNYCGACKSIGSLYGEKARLLLNNDIVFLAEILNSLSGLDTANWPRPYQSFNCFSLPKDEMPISLQFAASANIILAHFKIKDHISDSGKIKYKLAGRLFSPEFRAAENWLLGSGFPLGKIKKLLESQQSLEELSADIDELAFPTAETTGIFFEEGAALIEKMELRSPMKNLGFAFGKLIYLLDAYEDFVKDARLGEFNALQAAGIGRDKALPLMEDLEARVCDLINALPVSQSRKSIFISRLRENLDARLGRKKRIACRVHHGLPLKGRFGRAKERALELSSGYGWGIAFPVFLLVAIFAFISPIQAKEARSAKECAELGFNLIFIGSMIGAVLAIPKNLMQGYTPPDQPPLLEDNERKRDSWLSGCDGCCGADCCCDGQCCGEGCCCACDSCGDCCSCDCSS